MPTSIMKGETMNHFRIIILQTDQFEHFDKGIIGEEIFDRLKRLDFSVTLNDHMCGKIETQSQLNSRGSVEIDVV